MAHSPVVTRRRLGSELRRLRTISKKTIEQAAEELECSPAKISRLETGRGVPKQRDVRDLLRLYGVGANEVVYEEMLDLASEGQSQGWWNDFEISTMTSSPNTSVATSRLSKAHRPCRATKVTWCTGCCKRRPTPMP